MFKRNYRKIFLSLFLLLTVFSPLVAEGWGYGWTGDDYTQAKLELETVPMNCTVYSKLSVFNDGGWGFDVECMLAKGSYNIFYRPAAYLLSQSGTLFEFVVKETVLKMADNFYPSNSASAIDSTWVIFRDLANILFIFVLLYFSILTIINGTGKTGKMIATLIVVALLINFSLFFTKVVIDISNTASLSLYDSISSISRDNGNLPLENESLETGIASPFIAKTHLASLMEGKDLGLMQIAIQLTMGALLLAILGGVLLSMSLMLVSRFIILMFVLMISSIAFGSYILPQLKSKIFDRWLSVLIGQSLFAPLFLLCLYISITILNNLPNLGTGEEATSAGWSNVFKTNKELILVYILVIGFLIASLKISKSLADQSGSQSSRISGYISKGAVGTAGLAVRGVSSIGGFTGRHSIGFVGNSLAERSGSQTLRRAGMVLAKGSYDIRGLKTVQKVAGSSGISIGGARGVGGYRKGYDTGIKKRDEREKIAGQLTLSERKAIDRWNKMKNGENRDNIDQLESLEKKWKENLLTQKRLGSQIEGLNKMEQTDNIELEKTKLERQLEATRAKEKENRLAVESAELSLGGKDGKVLSAREAAKKAKDAADERRDNYANSGWRKGTASGREYARRYRNKKANKKDKLDELTETVAELKKAQEKK